MAIKTLENRKKQQKLIIISGVIILITLLILYFGIWKGSSPSTEVVQPGTDTTTQAQALLSKEKLKKINLSTGFLIKTILPALKFYGKTPVEKGITGRPNPFVAQ
jgi:hypothetical protein